MLLTRKIVGKAYWNVTATLGPLSVDLRNLQVTAAIRMPPCVPGLFLQRGSSSSAGELCLKPGRDSSRPGPSVCEPQQWQQWPGDRHTSVHCGLPSPETWELLWPQSQQGTRSGCCFCAQQGHNWLWGAHRCLTAPKTARQIHCTSSFLKNNQGGVSKRSWCSISPTWQTNTPASSSRNRSFL